MASRWKHPNHKNHHEQMKIRKLYGTTYWDYVQMIERHEDYDTYIIFNQ